MAQAGVATLCVDYPTFGQSEGEPRQDDDFVRDVYDFRDAVTYLQSQSEIDEARIGLCGIGHGGSKAIMLAAVFLRFKTVVLHLPATSGMIDESNWPAELVERLRESRDKAVESRTTRDPEYQPQFADSDSKPARVLQTGPIWKFFNKTARPMVHEHGIPWDNSITLASIERLRSFEGWVYPRNVPASILWLAAKYDEITPYEWQKEVFEAVPANMKELATYDTEKGPSILNPELFNRLLQKAVDFIVHNLLWLEMSNYRRH